MFCYTIWIIKRLLHANYEYFDTTYFLYRTDLTPSQVPAYIYVFMRILYIANKYALVIKLLRLIIRVYDICAISEHLQLN